MPKVDGAGQVWISTREIQELWYADEVPEHEQWRRYYGRSVTPGVIEEVLLAATNGYMRDITALGYETIMMDPHLAAIVGKRVRAIASVRPLVKPATGEGLDKDLAAQIADEVRRQLFAIPMLRQRITNLQWGHWNARALLEKRWRERRGGKIQWEIAELGWIHPHRLSFGPDREIRIRDDMWSGGRFEARGFDVREAPFKFIPFTPQLFDDYPEREGLNPRAQYYAFFKRFTWRQRMVLNEVYGKPWRVVEVEEGANVQPEQLDRAKETADKLGADATAAMPRGVKLQVIHPDGDNTAHQETSRDCDDQLSELILSNTRTTSAKGDGLGGGQAYVHQDSETLTFQSDGWNIGDVFTLHVARDIVILNWGEERLAYTPTIEFLFEQPRDPTKELERADKALSLGLPLKLSEVYERTGFTRPAPGDEIIQRAPAPAVPSLPGMPGAPSGAAPGTIGVMPRQPEENDGDDLGVVGEGGETALAASMRQERSRLELALGAWRIYGEHICFAQQPDTVNGSPEVLIDAGVREGARETGRWAEQLAAAVEGLDKPSEIFEALTRASRELPLSSFARAVERRMMHGAFLGALDSVYERENEEEIRPASFVADVDAILFAADGGEPHPNFVRRPFDDAQKWFKSLNVLDQDRFAELSAAAKRRAFTVARLARQELLVAAHAELSRQIGEGAATGGGADLRSFKKFVAERLESAGWTPANKSHVETIFRTNVMSAYSGGRVSEMTQPSVLQARPIWQWRSVQDDRARVPHRSAHGLLLPHDHQFWLRAFPPAGFNCRCRVISRSQAWFERNGGRFGTPPAGLPDDGWEGSGYRSFLAAA